MMAEPLGADPNSQCTGHFTFLCPSNFFKIIIMETYIAPYLDIKAQDKALTKTGNKLKERTAYVMQTRAHTNMYTQFLSVDDPPAPSRPPPHTYNHTRGC